MEITTPNNALSRAWKRFLVLVGLRERPYYDERLFAVAEWMGKAAVGRKSN